MPGYFIASLAVAAGGLIVMGLCIWGDSQRERELRYERIDREWEKLSEQKERYL